MAVQLELMYLVLADDRIPVMVLCASLSLPSFEMTVLLHDLLSRSHCIPVNSLLVAPPPLDLNYESHL
jgi:hypothetical protein